jgi:hypothetical protein
MLQAYRVIAPFSAQQLHREPLWVEHFEPGDLLVALGSEDGQTTFCRWVDSADLEDRRHFVVSDEDFENFTAAE